jgi:hypothetical protein
MLLQLTRPSHMEDHALGNCLYMLAHFNNVENLPYGPLLQGTVSNEMVVETRSWSG